MNEFNIILLLATFLNGLLAGVFYIWTNAITPGIGNLSDVSYLRSFQALNRTMLNPMFYIVFFGTIACTPIALFYQYFEDTNYIFWLLLFIFISYGLGVIGVTFLGNIPLNDRLEKLDLKDFKISEAKQFRVSYEAKWNKLHLIRTLTSCFTFVLLLLICLLK